MLQNTERRAVLDCCACRAQWQQQGGDLRHTEILLTHCPPRQREAAVPQPPRVHLRQCNNFTRQTASFSCYLGNKPHVDCNHTAQAPAAEPQHAAIMGCTASKGAEADTFSGMDAADQSPWDALMDFEWNLVDKGGYPCFGSTAIEMNGNCTSMPLCPAQRMQHACADPTQTRVAL